MIIISNFSNKFSILLIDKEIYFLFLIDIETYSFKTINFIESQYNFNKIIQKKNSPNLLHDIRSSSTSNFYPSNKGKKSLVYYPINLKIPMINNSNKNNDNKRIGNKSPIDIIKIPKTNLNNNNIKINYNTIKIKIKKIKILVIYLVHVIYLQKI